MNPRRSLAGAVLLVAILLQARLLQSQTNANPAPALDAIIPNADLEPDAYRLLINVTVAPSGGLRVSSLGPNSPTTHMVRDDDHSQVGNLEPGDVITHINGAPIKSIEGYYEAIKASNGDVKIAVVDKNSGKTINWEVQAVKVKVSAEGEDTSPTQNGTIHVLLIGLTKDDKIGTIVENDLKVLEPLFRRSVDSSRLDLKIIKDDDCNARFIIQSVREIGARSRPQDSIVVYYDGHGAHDSAFAKDDPSGGHFFPMPPPKLSPPGEGGDLMRKTLFENIQAQPGRLKILLSDSCNTRYPAHPTKQFRYEDRDVMLRGPTNFQQLFLYHQGYLDVNSTSSDETSQGQIFCLTFAERIPEFSEWAPFLKDLTKELETTIHPIKPAVFHMQLHKDKLPPKGRERMVRQSFLKLLPTETE